MTATATLPDRIVELLKKHNGIYVCDEGRLSASMAVQLNEKDPARVDDAMDALSREGLVRRGGGRQAARKVELTADGWKGAEIPPGGGAGGPKTVGRLETGEVLEAVDPNEFIRFGRRGGKRSWAMRVVDAFLQSCEPVVKVKGLQSKASAKRASIDTYLRKAELRDRVIVRVVDDELYLARRDVVELEVDGGSA